MKTFVITAAAVAIASTIGPLFGFANLSNANAPQFTETEAELAAYNYRRGTGRRQILS